MVVEEPRNQDGIRPPEKGVAPPTEPGGAPHATAPPTIQGALGPSGLRQAPGAVASLVLGTCAIAFGSLPVVGVVLAAIGIRRGRKSQDLVRRYPGSYSQSSIGGAGVVCSVIGLVWSLLCQVGYVVGIVILVMAA